MLNVYTELIKDNIKEEKKILGLGLRSYEQQSAF